MTDHDRKFLIFSLAGSLYALDLAQVGEVGDPPQMSPVPLVPEYMDGVLNIHGDIVAVMNLASFLKIAGCSQPEKIIVLQEKSASLAFLVDKVVRIISEHDVSCSSAPENGFAVATLLIPGGEALLLDLGAIINEAEMAIQKNNMNQMRIC